MFWHGKVFKVFKNAEIYTYIKIQIGKRPKGYSIVKASSMHGQGYTSVLFSIWHTHISYGFSTSTH